MFGEDVDSVPVDQVQYKAIQYALTRNSTQRTESSTVVCCEAQDQRSEPGTETEQLREQSVVVHSPHANGVMNRRQRAGREEWNNSTCRMADVRPFPFLGSP